MAKGKKTGGRVKGTPNKTTRIFKEAVLDTFDGIGGTDAFRKWAQANPSEFYKIAARLIPTESHVEVTGQDGGPVEIAQHRESLARKLAGLAARTGTGAVVSQPH